MEKVVIVDCGSGNLRSAAKAFERAAADGKRSVSVEVTNSPDAVRRADRVALPGQGAFAAVLAGVADVPGLREALREVAITRARPFLGICVGMQLMADRGLEHGSHKGFGWIAGDVVPLAPADTSLKVPHMGWNDLTLDRPDHPVLAGIATGDHAYFVHSYRFDCADPADRLAHADYGGQVTAIVGRDNLVGTQFHPEKSQSLGLSLIASFLEWRP
ncbi:MAG TPA: imidazole glycerol phosphate synthase subunit HisH [Alphaproteobacteria bacterium]|nr:imidazole glycerol phosphate synthase subunit HisH [Alphaproteobacteria bacterium]